jgi:hypothetical protein
MKLPNLRRVARLLGVPFVGVLAASTGAAGQETLTIELVGDKAALRPGEDLTISVYATLDPGIGSPVWFVPVKWTEQVLGEVMHLTCAQFWFVSQSQPVQWVSFKKNAGMYYGEPGPIFTANAIVKLVCCPTKGYYVDKSWLFDVTLKLSDYTPGTAVFGLQINNPPGASVVCQAVDETKWGEVYLYGWKAYKIVWSPLEIEVLPECWADCDRGGTLNIDDFVCFQTLFAIGDPAADCDGDGTLLIDDFVCFQAAFAVGC